jgi:hypothetical protein
MICNIRQINNIYFFTCFTKLNFYKLWPQQCPTNLTNILKNLIKDTQILILLRKTQSGSITKTTFVLKERFYKTMVIHNIVKFLQ